jgi:hypothetical protein
MPPRERRMRPTSVVWPEVTFTPETLPVTISGLSARTT